MRRAFSLPSDTVFKAIMVITLTYFGAYVALTLVRTYNQVCRPQMGASPFEKVLESAATSCVYFGPALCAIFLAGTKRASNLTAGDPSTYGLPFGWLKCCILVCSIFFVLQTLAYVTAEWFLLADLERERRSERDAFGQPSLPMLPPLGSQSNKVRRLRRLHNVTTVAMHATLFLSTLGIICMKQPNAVLQASGRVSPNTGTLCSLTLCITYLLVYLFLHVSRGRWGVQASSGDSSTTFALELLRLAATAMNFAPMLGILFVAVQTAADWGDLPLAKNLGMCMFVSTGAVLLQSTLVALAPVLARAELQVVGPKGEVDFVTYRHSVFVFMSIVRWTAMCAMYLGVGVLCYTLPVVGEGSQTALAVRYFAMIYFAAYLAQWLTVTLKQLMGGGFEELTRVLQVAKETVVLCPMLAVIFFEAFDQAHGLTTPDAVPGQPQGFVQDAAKAAVCAQAVQVILILGIGFFPSPTSRGWLRASVKSLLRLLFHVAMCVLYTSVGVAAYGVFTITSRTATGKGAIFF